MSRAPVTVITGEIGAGKTTLVRELLRRLPDEVTVALISNAQGDRGQLLHWVLLALGQTADNDASYVHLFTQFQNYLIDQYAAGKSTLLIFDEAQNLPVETLEELRMFTNINADKDELLQIVLVGQPQLRDKISRPELEQFSQRVSSDYHLAAMTEQDVDQYIAYRLRVAGADREIFNPGARRLVHQFSRGIPRLINKICENALVYAYGEDRHEVDEATISRVVADWKNLGHTEFKVAEDRRKKLGPQDLLAKIETLSSSGLSSASIQKRLLERSGQDVPLGKIDAAVAALIKDTRAWLTRPLPASLGQVFFDEAWVRVRADGKVETLSIVVVLAHDENGRSGLVAASIGDAGGSDFYSSILQDLKIRGARKIEIASVEGSDAFTAAIEEAFQDALVVRSVGQLLCSMIQGAATRDREDLASELSSSLAMGSGVEARQRLVRLQKSRSSRTGPYVDHSHRSWRGVELLLAQADVARRLVPAACSLAPIAQELNSVLNAPVSFPSRELVIQKIFIAGKRAGTESRRP